MCPRRKKLAVFLPAMAALGVVMAMLSTACLNLMTEPVVLSTGASASPREPARPLSPSIPKSAIPVQLASLSASGAHHVIFTYYDGSAVQTWAFRMVESPDTTLKDFPSGNPALPGHVFVRWIYADTNTDPVTYPEFTTRTRVTRDIEVRAYHQALPTLSYDANGAEGPTPASVSVPKAGEAVRLASQGNLTGPAGTSFGGWFSREWNGSAFVETALYQAGTLYQLACSTTLYARWDPLP